MPLDVFDVCHTHTAATARKISFACPKCGITKRSGKISCCGRGGSWFGNCGSVGYETSGHTWYEGLQACKARRPSHTDIVLNVDQQRRDKFPDSDKKEALEAVTTVAKRLIVSSASLATLARVRTPANTSKAHATTNTTITFTLSNASIAASSIMAVDTPDTTSARVLINHNFTNTLKTTEVHRGGTSEGWERLLDTAVGIAVSLAVELFK